MAKLGEICEILDSKRIPITASDRRAGPYPYYGANGVQDYVDDYIFDDELVLLAEDGGNFGSKDKPIAYRVSGKCWVNNHAHVLKPKDGVDIDYLCYSLMFYDVSALVNGATRQKLTQADMRKMEVPIPPFAEQRKIAAVLDKVSDLIAKRRQQLTKLDELVKARFVEISADESTTITAIEACEVIVDCPHSTPEYAGDNRIYPAIRTSEIRNGQIDWTSMRYVGDEEYKRRSKRLVPMAGDIVYAREGTYGDCVILPKQKKFCLGQRTMLFRPNYKICTSEYLHQALRSDSVKRQADESNAGSTVPHVNVADAKKFTFPIPSIEKQHKFSSMIKEVTRLQLNINCSLEKLKMLKKTLMQEYFG